MEDIHLKLPQPLGETTRLRLSPKIEQTTATLGPLSDLIGTWIGNTGWNIIAVPVDDRRFSLLVRPYAETITFSALGAPVPNRDEPHTLLLMGLEYNLRITDLETNQPLHIETGMWLFQDQTDTTPRLTRLSVIPHGDSLLATGDFSVSAGPPTIADNSALPDSGPDTPFGYADVYFQVKGVDPSNPNGNLQKFLEQQQEQGQIITETTTLFISTDPTGGLVNIPFITKHVDATKFSSVFWIENVRDTATGQEFMQLQYSQQTDLHFLPKFGAPGRIMWPHVNINTLVKQ